MSRNHLLSVRIRCRCDESIPGCIRVDRQVPPELQCTPSGGARGGDRRIRCQRCRHVCFESYEHLEKAVNDLVHRPSWGQYMTDGFVPIPCDG